MIIDFWCRLKNKELIIYTFGKEYKWSPKVIGYFR
jgi:hypothetical protein